MSGSFPSMWDLPPLRRLFDEKFLRFVLVGFSNFLVSFALFHLLLLVPVTFAVKTAISQLISYSGGAVWSYYWNRRFTFRSQGVVLPQAARFLTLQASLALISSVLIGLCVDVLGLPPTPSWWLVMIPATIVNFLTAKLWVFKK
jgi:putative flippase GtrA